MLSFVVYSEGRLADHVNLEGAYLVGSDDVPLRAEINFADGVITCRKRAAGPAGLALLWKVGAVGEVMVETIRVQERERPYILQIELARGRLLRVLNKIEDWGLLDEAEELDCSEAVDEARETLIRSLQAEEAPEAARVGALALEQAVAISEDVTRRYAEHQLGKRRQSGTIGRRVFGCGVHLDKPSDLLRQRIGGAFDFVTVPIVWRELEPAEQSFNWKGLESWVELLGKQRVSMRGAPLLSFHEENVPDWLYIWEHDFETIRDLAFEHARRVINRYGQYIQNWVVVSGIHAHNCFSFNFEQLMELTRMTAALTKQLAPRGSAIIELVYPWGEYYARNQRTIPPALYAEMIVQSGINFDAFGVQILFGPARDGMYVRDLFQISAMLDQFGKLGKPVHVTAVEAPSESRDGKGGPEVAVTGADGGVWHEPWSEEAQRGWVEQLLRICMSKPAVETVAWNHLCDHAQQLIPHGGLLRADLSPKPAYKELVQFRSELLGRGRRRDGVRS